MAKRNRIKPLGGRLHSSGERSASVAADETAPPDRAATAPGEVVLRSKSNLDFVHALRSAPPVSDNEEVSSKINALVGIAAACDDHHLAALPCREVLTSDLARRITPELVDPAVTVCHVVAHLPLSRVIANSALFDGIVARDGRELSRLAANSYWVPVPRIIGDGDVLDIVLEGILFEAGLDEVIDERVREPSFRLARQEMPQPIVATKLGRDEAAIRLKIRSMCCVQRSHLPRHLNAEARFRAAHRLLQVRSVIEAKQLTKLDRGEGRIHMRAALERARKLLPDRKAALASKAPKSQRARDVANLMRRLQFNESELPFVKF